MNYTWDIKELKRHKASAFFNGEKEAYSFYDRMIRLYLDKKPKYIKEPKMTFDLLMGEYNYFNDLFKTDLFDEIISLYNLINDENVFSNTIITLEQNTINFNDTINLTSQYLKNILSAQDYNKIKNFFLPDRNLLNTKNNPDSSRSYEYCTGTCFIAPDEVKSYINMYVSNTYMDIETLMHELMHALFNQLYYDQFIINKNNETHYLYELEGAYASMLANKYITDELNKNEGLKLSKIDTNCIFNSSYLLYLYNTLFITSDKNKFNLIEMNNKVHDEMNIDDEITAENVQELLNINPFELYTDILSYLISLNVFTNLPDPKEGLEAIKKFKKMDNSKLQDNISHTLIEDSIVLLEKNYQKTLHIK